MKRVVFRSFRAKNYGGMKMPHEAGDRTERMSARAMWFLVVEKMSVCTSAMDLLFGGEGHDLIVGGGGNDAILGDGHVTYASRDWSFAVIRDGNTIWAHTLWTSGIDRMEGTVPGDDTIYDGVGDDYLVWMEGDQDL